MRKIENPVAQETRAFDVFNDDTGDRIGVVILASGQEAVLEEPWIAFSINTSMFPAAMKFFKTPQEATKWIAGGRYE